METTETIAQRMRLKLMKNLWREHSGWQQSHHDTTHVSEWVSRFLTVHQHN